METDSRTLLIAINSSRRLHRDSICRLALGLDLWRHRRRPSTELGHAIGIATGQLAIAFELRGRASERAQRQEELAQRHDVRISTVLDPDYPHALRDLELPPPVLFLRGALPQRPAIAIVGSRSADLYGRQATELFAAALARRGLTVVSGLARGVDSIAHSSALEQPAGSSVAVVGCGLDLDYPRGSRKLRQRLSEGGAIISEFPFSTPPWPANFPIRNRIIAALGTACLVVQAATRSGSLITARHALELGRDVYAVPGRIFDRLAKGTNALIRDGAFPVEHPRDIIETLPLAVQDALDPSGDSRPQQASLPGHEGRLVAELRRGRSLTAEDLATAVELPLSTVHSLLLELELTGWVRRHPGALFSRVPSRHL